jgi:MFS transporter, MHS family, shikimate and dehydroshikimate transport protein
MSTARDTARPVRARLWRTIGASMSGTVLEYYDFLVYGTVAALQFNTLFFPSSNPAAGVLASFATFAVGYLARPVGSVLFGHFGDRLGRRGVLIVTMMTMGLSTFAIGLIPAYAQIGIVAPILLVLLRVVQGIAVGGEWGGAAVLLIENASPKRKGLLGSISQMGSPAGLFLGTGAVSLAVLLSGDSFASWGWRLPFLAGGVLVLIGLYMRAAVRETPEFEQLRDAGTTSAVAPTTPTTPTVPILAVLQNHWRAVLLAFLIGSPGNAVFFIIAVYTLNYGTTTLQLDRTMLLTGVMIVAVLEFVTTPVFGWLSDRLGYRTVIMFGAVCAAVFALGYFPVLSTGNPALMYLVMAFGLGIAHPALQAPMAALFSARFPIAMRYTGVALSQVIPPTLVGGTLPLVASALFLASGSTTPISVYVIVLAALGFIGAAIRLRSDRTDRDHDRNEVEPHESERSAAS